ENHLVYARAEDPGQDRPLSHADDVVGGQVLAARLTMAPPEPEHDRRGHEDAVPAHGKRTHTPDLRNLKNDGSPRGEHDALRYLPRRDSCKKRSRRHVR